MQIISFDTIDSTQTWAKTHSASFPKDQITCIIADEQTQGRGRYDRTWVSPKGQNLYITFYFCLPTNTPNISCLAQLISLSLAKTLLELGLFPQIKWPNDLLLSQKKLAGILCETSFQNKIVEIFLGIGINVNMPQDLLSTIDQPATSLLAETKHLWDRSDLLGKLQKAFEKDLDTFQKKGFAHFLPLLDSLLAYKKKKVSLFDGKNRIEGILDSINEDGSLRLYLPQTKEMKSFLSGDLFPSNS
jgi:BirA family biotin operon repressor/biotin-[acetyl-CoA-carboxylase] ligase